jgi:hypothetical protein
VTEQVLFVDYENLPKLDLAAIPHGVKIPFFFGASQRTVTQEFLKSALKLGERFIHIAIEGQGKNALDFHIAYYLGEYLTKTPNTECVILSRDKGFDPLVRHLVARGFAVRRVATVAEGFALPGAASKLETQLNRVIQLLSKVDRNRRPRKRQTLLGQIRSYLPKSPAHEIEALVARMEHERKISQEQQRLIYHF